MGSIPVETTKVNAEKQSGINAAIGDARYKREPVGNEKSGQRIDPKYYFCIALFILYL